MTRRLLVTLAVAGIATMLVSGTASARPGGDPSVVRTANPAHACASIPGTLESLAPLAEELFGITLEWDFSYRDCVRALARGERQVDFGDPLEQCAALENGIFGFELTYPFTFHAEPGDPFPDLVAHNRDQCANALYAFHTIETILIENGVPAEE